MRECGSCLECRRQRLCRSIEAVAYQEPERTSELGWSPLSICLTPRRAVRSGARVPGETSTVVKLGLARTGGPELGVVVRTTRVSSNIADVDLRAEDRPVQSEGRCFGAYGHPLCVDTCSDHNGRGIDFPFVPLFPIGRLMRRTSPVVMFFPLTIVGERYECRTDAEALVRMTGGFE